MHKKISQYDNYSHKPQRIIFLFGFKSLLSKFHFSNVQRAQLKIIINNKINSLMSIKMKENP